MHFRRFLFWLVFAIYWCDGLCDDQPERVEPIQNVPPEHQYRSRDSSSSENTYTMISKTISKAVNNESKCVCNEESGEIIFAGFRFTWNLQ